MSALQKTLTAVLLLLLLSALYGSWYTSQPTRPVSKSTARVAHEDQTLGIDQNAYVLAKRLVGFAEGPEEQNLAASAVRLADHELDLAFTAALRRLEANPPVLSPEAQKIEDRLQKAQKTLDTDQATVARLTAALAQASDSQRNLLQDQLDLANSQVELDKDEVEEANQDLLRAGGNQHQRVQMMMQEHANAEQVHASPSSGVTERSGTTAHGLIGLVQRWLGLRHKEQWLLYAAAEASSTAALLSAKRGELAQQLQTVKAGVPELAGHVQNAPPAGPADAASPNPKHAAAPADTASPDSKHPAASTDLLTNTRRIAADQRRLTLLDQRIYALTQLVAVYTNWKATSGVKTVGVLHEMLLDLTAVVAIVLLLMFVDRWLQRLLGRTRLDRRQMETLRSVARVALQVVGVVAILLIIIGIPSQLGTMIGLAGAGLTVALKDFIVAFIGWLVLMGRNGVRLGDWVEINGVTGEVVELGMFHTVLLETGNSTDAGHPTGRRVTFTNSFAIEKHYFNYSTSGQWLWDELLVLVPYDKDPNLIAEAIHKEVVAATAESSQQAEDEWRRTGPGRRGSVFAATPGVSVKPAVGGVEVSVRYITRASERFKLRARLFQSAVRLLGKGALSAPPEPVAHTEQREP